MRSGFKAGSYARLMHFCITQIQAFSGEVTFAVWIILGGGALMDDQRRTEMERAILFLTTWEGGSWSHFVGHG
jgi:hypothetical protein